MVLPARVPKPSICSALSSPFSLFPSVNISDSLLLSGVSVSPFLSLSQFCFSFLFFSLYLLLFLSLTHTRILSLSFALSPSLSLTHTHTHTHTPWHANWAPRRVCLLHTGRSEGSWWARTHVTPANQALSLVVWHQPWSQEQADLAISGHSLSCPSRVGPGNRCSLCCVWQRLLECPGSRCGPLRGWTEGLTPSEFMELDVLQLVSYFYKIPITQLKDKHHRRRKWVTSSRSCHWSMSAARKRLEAGLAITGKKYDPKQRRLC